VLAAVASCVDGNDGDAHSISADLTVPAELEAKTAYLVMRSTVVALPPLQFHEMPVTNGHVVATFDGIPSDGKSHILYLHVDANADGICDDAGGTDPMWGALISDADGRDASLTFSFDEYSYCQNCCSSLE